jgi:hypothetical protein
MNELPTQPGERTAYRMLRQFNEGGYISKEAKRWQLTELGEHHTKTKMNYLLGLPPIRRKQAG